MNDASLMLYAGNVTRIGILIFVGIPFVRWCSSLSARLSETRLSHHGGILISRIIFYSGLIFIGVTILHEFGFNVTALLGAAGVIGVAIGFASQTSISNIISGIFLLAERPFSVNDTIKSGDIIGTVESIDLLAVRVRTSDNKLVRLPNEMVLKHSLVNLTYYSVRRVDCIVSVPYADSIEDVKQIITEVIARNSMFLSKPAPVVAVNKMAQHDYNTETRVFFRVCVFVAKQNFGSASALLMQQLKDEFDKKSTVITAVQMN